MYPNVTKVKSTIYSFIICMRSSLMPHAFLLRVIPCPINLVQLVDPRACSLAAASPRADKPAWDVLMVRNMKDHIYRFTVQDAPNLQNPIIPEQSVEDMIQKTLKGCHWATFFPEINQRLLSLACENWSSLQESFSPPAAGTVPCFSTRISWRVRRVPWSGARTFATFPNICQNILQTVLVWQIM